MSKKSLTISVIIPNYNYGRFLGEAIESVLRQTLAPIEIIVVDDGSQDESVEVAESFGQKVTLIKQKNGGVGTARNTGAKRSTGDLLAFLDADDVWLPDKLLKQSKIFQNNSEVGYVTCGMREFDVSGKTIAEYVPAENGWSKREILLFEKPLVVSGSAIVLRRELFDELGGFDERRDLHPSEDWEFAYRAVEKSKIAAVAELLVDYRNHGNNGHLKVHKTAHSMCLAYEKIFAQADHQILSLKNNCYGQLHTQLAGSYFQAGEISPFLGHTLKAFWYNPQKLQYYLAYPFRFLERKKKKSVEI